MALRTRADLQSRLQDLEWLRLWQADQPQDMRRRTP